MTNYITPDWPAPKQVKAFSSTKQGGFSQGSYASFNLGKHVEDNPEHVEKNRAKLITDLNIPSSPHWIKQTHSNIVMPVTAVNSEIACDAIYTATAQQVCIILTADCLPILICNKAGTEVAAIHAGWRGLATNIVANTIAKFSDKPAELIAWLGPAIGAKHFEVGGEVRDIFLENNPKHATAFVYNQSMCSNKWLADIYMLATQCLAKCGVQNVFGGNYCTYTQSELFFSYRRDQQVTGRMATLIWLED